MLPSRAATPKPSGGIRSFLSLSALGLPTPLVALACIGNADIQVFSDAGCQVLFLRRLQAYLFIIFHVQQVSQGVTLLFFFTEKKKRSKKEKSSHFTCTVRFQYHTRITRDNFIPVGSAQNYVFMLFYSVWVYLKHGEFRTVTNA